jgi:hypothetical protein
LPPAAEARQRASLITLSGAGYAGRYGECFVGQ